MLRASCYTMVMLGATWGCCMHKCCAAARLWERPAGQHMRERLMHVAACTIPQVADADCSTVTFGIVYGRAAKPRCTGVPAHCCYTQKSPFKHPTGILALQIGCYSLSEPGMQPSEQSLWKAQAFPNLRLMTAVPGPGLEASSGTRLQGHPAQRSALW